MNIGNFVSSNRFPSPGIVVRKWIQIGGKELFRSYRFTIDLLDVTGKVITIDIHNDDEWKVIS